MSSSIIQRVQEFLKQNPILSETEFLDKNFLKHSFADPDKKDIIWTLIPKIKLSEKRHAISKPPFDDVYIHFLLYVRNLFKSLYVAVEGQDIVTQKSWSSSESHGLQGGGVMTVIRGETLEKSAVNLSVVSGQKYPGKNAAVKDDEDFEGKPFVAAGVSLISHPKNPNAPIMHLNIRMLKVFGDKKTHQWIGGGADLTPMELFDEDTNEFHTNLQTVCEKNESVADYDDFKQWADEYFFIPHRKEARGVGGIFFDFIPVKSDKEVGLLFDLSQYAAHTYANILSRRVDMPYTEQLAEKHEYWRGRYAEFNLIYDRGTRFGLMSGGNHEAIFCSLPPRVRW